MTPAATGAADTPCAVMFLGRGLVAVVGERDGDSRDGVRREALMSFVAADGVVVELKANTLVGTEKEKKQHYVLFLSLLYTKWPWAIANHIRKL